MGEQTTTQTETTTDGTLRIPMTSPRGHRTRYVKATEVAELGARGWYRETRPEKLGW
jgi:hypothetical protein